MKIEEVDKLEGILDYSLTGINARRAAELGLAEADWYQSPVPHTAMRDLLARKDGPAIRDTFLLISVLAATATITTLFWGTWWAVLAYMTYAVFYGTASDSRWHECGHGTAFRTDWLNNVVYEVASFMVMRESIIWRWSHIRHHSDTIIVGRDPEIQVPRPPDITGLLISFVNFGGYKGYYAGLARHATGKMTDAEKEYVPETEFHNIYKNARMCILVYVLIIASAFVCKSWIPIFLFILPQFFGTWLMIVHNTTQHAGLAENVLDHRLNCRTVYMNPINRFIYWNMNYHVEHHMFPLVPYHALPKLHQLVKGDCPPVYPSIYAAWREIIPTLYKQVKDPAHHIKRKLPEPKNDSADNILRSASVPDRDGWVKVLPANVLENEDVIRFDHAQNTYAIYRDNEGKFYATDGICTHGNTHLSEGLVKGKIIECPKHNGRFNLENGSPARAPICRSLSTFQVELRDGFIWLNISKSVTDAMHQKKIHQLRVVSNNNVSTFIKELVVEPADAKETIEFTPGDYLQINIPKYKKIRFSDFDIQKPYRQVWEQQDIFSMTNNNLIAERRNNYSIASNWKTDKNIRFNIRIATPPPGHACAPGVGSSYLFSLKPGDIVDAIGPFGDFYIKSTQREMVYVGGGAGMAPIRAHIAHLFENEKTRRKVSYWYGARSKQELFYEDYFNQVKADHQNFDFQAALSSPLETDQWLGHHGFIHDVVFKNYLKNHPNVKGIEFYLCGPPMMIKACKKMLSALRVDQEQIAYDEY